MSGSGGRTETNKTQTTDLNPLVQPFVGDILNEGRALYKNGIGSRVWSGKNVADLNPAMSHAIGLLGSDGLTGGQRNAAGAVSDIASGANGIGTGGVYGGLLGHSLGQNQDAVRGSMGVGARAAMAPTYSEGLLGDVASGSAVEPYTKQLQDIAESNPVNPYVTQMLEDTNARIANRVNSSMSGMGRYGSGSHTDVLAKTLAETDKPILAQEYDAGMNRKIAASGGVNSARVASAGARTGAAGTMDSARHSADTTALGAFGQGANIRQGDTGLALNATGGMTGVEDKNIANRMNAAGSAYGMYGGGADKAFGVGQYLQNRDQADLMANRELFEQQQAMPWTQLSRYLGTVGGLSGLLHGTGTTTARGREDKTAPWKDFLKMGGDLSSLV